MTGPAVSSAVSATALQAGAGELLHPEPEWITRAADDFGWAWARVHWQRAAKVPGAWFDADKADTVVRRWPKTFKLTTKRFAGKPFNLSFWQEVIVRLMVGWKRPIEILDEISGKAIIAFVRIFQELRLWIPRKNGKSEFLAALALLFWAIEGEHRGAGFCFAHNERQAREVFNKMADMAESAPPKIAAEIQQFAKSLWCQRLKSGFQVLPGKAAGSHGFAPSVTVGDEMHEWKSKELADNLRQGEGTSLQPVRLYASTAGLKTQLVGKAMWDESLQLLDGTIDDASVLTVIFAAPEDADWRDEAVWRACNPSIGLSPTIDFLRREFAKAQTPAGEAAFRRYHLNQWVEEIAKWIPLKKWDACGDGKPAWKAWPEELKGRRCTLAFDATKSFDFASMCLRFEPVAPGEKVKFIWKHWLPADTIAARAAAEKVGFDRWQRDGAITEIPGAVFVLAWAIKEARAASRDYQVDKIGWDSWNALEFYNRLVSPGAGDDERPLPEDLFVEMRFGTKTLGAATREFERKVLAGELAHGGNPVVRWMIGHARVRFDENMNYVPAKKLTENSIDGVMTAVMCEALAMTPTDRVDLDAWLKQPMVIRQ
jgi:phage terminase large subunit-like protein